MSRRKRNAGSSSDGTEDSDISTDPEHTDSSESDGASRQSARVTRSSARLSQSSQDSSPVQSPPSFGAEDPLYSTRRVTCSQQQSTPITPKKYPLRQTRSSGSETEQVVDFSDRDTKNAADHDESPPRTPTGNAPSSESDIDLSSPNMSHDESIAKDMSMKDSGSDLSQRPKRRRFHESYNFNMKCPTPGCNSLGHLTGKHERHFSISGCPLYHNLSADECKVRAQSRDKQVEERMLSHRQDDNRQATRHQAPTEIQLRYKEKVAEVRKKRNAGLTKEQKEKYMEHRKTYGNTREPLLENLTSEYDLELFRRAQARASEDLVTTDYGINQNVPEEESTEIEVEFISSDNPFFSNLENQKKQRLRPQNTKQLHRKENRKRRLLQRKGFIFSQRLLQARRMDLLVEREALLWKPVWHRKKPRIRLKKKFKNV